MYKSLELFQTAIAMARHAGAGQAVVARNIANADTPGFRAQHVNSFEGAYTGSSRSSQRATRAGHMTGAESGMATARATASSGEPSPNGNTVSLEEELLNSVAVSREHNQALAIYRHTLTVLRTSLGK
ncbi:FlgB family protein [Yoonia sp.]|jgi:flagellar basal-body rod protein FlgB|uniref:FlgB family protein n=1 Tax=Yoonia sp. TaxID=2212373 RepID=UPI0025FE7FED|nr:FlgB family protein [Yoonia sp.]